VCESSLQALQPIFAAMKKTGLTDFGDERFHEFMADEMTMVKRVYEFAEQPMTEDVQRAVKSFMAANPKGRLGRIAYHLEEDFGLDPRERRQALRFYQGRFDVPDE
jgi:hypothetical protein